MVKKEESIQHMLGRLLRIINKHSRIEGLPVLLEGGCKLTAKEAHCLQAIGLNEGSNVKELGDSLGVTKSAMSQMVTKLENRGLAIKRDAPDNDKEILVYLTGVGWEAFAIHREFHERHLKSLLVRLEEFPDEQIATVSLVLSVIETIVDDRMAELFNI